MIFRNPYWSNKIRMELLEKWLIIHSIIYYELNDSLVDDETFDNNGKQLIQMIKDDSASFRETKWYAVFKGYGGDGCLSGFDLINRLGNKQKKALFEESERVLKNCKTLSKKLKGMR